MFREPSVAICWYSMKWIFLACTKNSVKGYLGRPKKFVAGSLLSWPLWSCQGTEWAKEIVAVCLMLCDRLFREESERWAPSSVGRVGRAWFGKGQISQHSRGLHYPWHWSAGRKVKSVPCACGKDMEKRASCAISQIESPLVYFQQCRLNYLFITISF